MMSAASSCSGSQPTSSRKYDVFISFRGEDTRNNFTSHLHNAFTLKSLRTYIDYQLRKGDDISSSLTQAIKDSSVSVVVFSANYASSKWCLDELSQIIKHRKDEGHFVIPVFYKVEPSDVRHKKGTYKEAFEKHERDLMHDQDKVNKWKDALSEAANLNGWHFQTFMNESEFILEIVHDVVKKLGHLYPSTLKHVIGIDENIKNIEELLEKVHKVGIWGMGGLGKTTMAKAVFAKLSSQYQSCCFLENVREESEKHGLKHVHETLVSELLMEESMQSNPPKAPGSAFVIRRLSCKKVFIVLDDVDSLEQLEYLAEVCVHLGAGSKVIITSRDRHLLKRSVDEIHDAKPLKEEESFKLFNFKAFGKYHPHIGYEQLATRAVDYAKGIPLALIVLGSFLYCKDKEDWDSALRKLTGTPNENIQQVLKLSYVGLDHKEKQIFLDIACFLKGENEKFVKDLFDSYDFHATIGIRNLLNKALVAIMDERVWMHDLIQEMGLEIVRQESIKKPGRRSRLWDPREIYDVLKNNKGTDDVEGIMLDLSQIRELHLTANTFKKMTRLRFLKFYSPGAPRSRNVQILTGIDSISSKIGYFQWDGYPWNSMPSNFCAENLTELNMESSNVQTLWEGVQDLVNLRRLNLRDSCNLRVLPDFSKAQNLERVDLSDCASLCYVHPSLLSLHSLVSLDLMGCQSLKSLQSKTHLRSLKELIVYGCSSLKQFSMSSEELTYLNLKETGIEILSPSIGRCSKLTTLLLNGSKLKILPIQELGCLRSLKRLWIHDHIIDKARIHMLLDALCHIEELGFPSCCNLIELPNNIKKLSKLQKLDLSGCRNLQCLPELPLSIEELNVTDCSSLSISCSSMYSTSIGSLSNLESLHLNVSSLGNLPITMLCCFRFLSELRLCKCSHEVDQAKLNILFDALQFLKRLYLDGWPNLTELPDNIRHLLGLQYLSLEDCTMLRFLPELPWSLRNLIAYNCTSLERVSPSTISSPLKKFGKKIFSFINCVKLDARLLGIIRKQAKLSLKQAVHNKEDVTVYYPGKMVPKWFGDNRTLKESENVELTLASDNLLGFIFCCVIPQIFREEESKELALCFYGVEDGEMNPFVIFNPEDAKFSSGNVLLHCDPEQSEFILKRIEGSRRNHEATTYNRKLLFKFWYGNGYIKECGVYPIYASKCHNFVQKGKFQSIASLTQNVSVGSERTQQEVAGESSDRQRELKLRTEKRTQVVPLSRYLFLSYYQQNRKRRRLHI